MRVSVRGSHEREAITAVSHQPNVDYDFILNNGSRTRVAEQGSPGVVRGSPARGCMRRPTPRPWSTS